MSFIRKHAAALALLAALLCAFAAPYLIPANPDSGIFRYGTLGAVLIVSCFLPLRQAYERASRRELIAGLFWGLLFSAALSLGSELLIYDGLLSGMGSLIRRFAVPVMAAPLIGGLCTRLMILPAPAAKARRRIPAWVFFALILACWVPVWLAYFPGMLNYDFVGEYTQHVSGSYTNLHPLLHSFIMNGIITLGEKLHSTTLGLMLMTILQMTLFAASLAGACAFAQRRGAPLPALAGMAALFALHPVFSVMSMSMTKDTLFAAVVLTLSLETYELIEAPDVFFANKRRCVRYVLLAACAALLRSNGVFALALLLPGAVIALRGHRRRMLLLGTSCAAAALAGMALLTLALTPDKLPSFQFYSLPAQQLVRAYNSGKLSEADRAEIASWYTSEEGLIVHPHLADPAKGYLDRERLEEEGDDFLALWERCAAPCAKEYLEAFLMLNIGSWYPDDLSHSTIYPDVSWNDKGYLQTQEYDMSEYGFHTRSLLPAVRDVYERICRRNDYQKYPLVSILFAPATPFWLLLLACAALMARRRTRLLPAALGVLGLWLSYLLGPCTLPRYALPLFCLAPPLLAAALCQSPAKEVSAR